MKHMFRKLPGLVAILALATTSAARADFGPIEVCGGSNFTTCASVQLQWNAAGTAATITVTNIGDPADIITAIGLTGLNANQATASAYDIQITNVTNDPTSLWQEGGSQLSGDNIQTSVAQAQSVSGRSVAGSNRNYSNVANGLADGATLTIVFTFTSQVENRGSVGVAMHAQSGPNGCSTKLAIDANGVAVPFTGVGDAACTSTVPEPATMGLVTTGLLGLGGAGFLRRRKKA